MLFVCFGSNTGYINGRCIIHRELIKLAQRMAHAIERDRSYASIQWRIQFFKQLHTPSPDTKIYPHFFQYVYVAIYRSLRATAQNIEQNIESTIITSEPDFEPIQKNIRKKSCIYQKKAVPLHRKMKNALKSPI